MGCADSCRRVLSYRIQNSFCCCPLKHGAGLMGAIYVAVCKYWIYILYQRWRTRKALRLQSEDDFKGPVSEEPIFDTWELVVTGFAIVTMLISYSLMIGVATKKRGLFLPFLGMSLLYAIAAIIVAVGYIYFEYILSLYLIVYTCFAYYAYLIVLSYYCDLS